MPRNMPERAALAAARGPRGARNWNRKTRGDPDGAVHHLGPRGVAEEAGEAEDEAAGEAGGAGAPEAAAEEVAEGGRHQVNRHVIPGEGPPRDVAVFERQQKEDPIQRIGGAGLRLAEEWLAGPQVGVPERGEGGGGHLRRCRLR